MANSIHTAQLPVEETSLSANGNSRLPQLKAVYQRYGSRIYSLLLRLLVDKNAAEAATVDVFVRFRDELASQPTEAQVFLRLRQLAVETALRRVNRHSMAALRQWLYNKFPNLRRY